MTFAMSFDVNSSTAFPAPNWCADDDARHNIRARRNVLAGLWAARKFGLAPGERASYAAALHHADYAIKGDGDIVAKLVRDSKAHAVDLTPEEIAHALRQSHAQALRECCLTD